MTTVVDAIGKRHARFANPPALRIACLVPSITETLFALGLGDKVVARTGFCIHPEPAVRDIPKVGGTKDVNVSKLLDTEPTHVIVNIDENRKEMVDHLRKVIPHVIVTHPLAPEDNVSLFHLLGHIFSVEEAALRLSRELANALMRARALGARMPTQTALYLIWKNPWMTISRDTYVSAMLATVGWKTLPLQAAKRYPEVPREDRDWQDAERIFLSSEPYLFDEVHIDDLKADGRLKQPVQLIDGEMVSWYGVRAIAGLHYLADLREQRIHLSDQSPVEQGLIAERL